MSMPTYRLPRLLPTEDAREPRSRCPCPRLFMRGRDATAGPKMPSGLKTPVEGANLSPEDNASARRRRPSPGFRPLATTAFREVVGEIQARSCGADLRRHISVPL